MRARIHKVVQRVGLHYFPALGATPANPWDGSQPMATEKIRVGRIGHGWDAAPPGPCAEGSGRGEIVRRFFLNGTRTTQPSA
jgi:hypothetical protein